MEATCLAVLDLLRAKLQHASFLRLLFSLQLFYLEVVAQVPGGNLDFESAVPQEVSTAQELKLQNRSDPISLAVNVTADSDSRAVTRLAALFPALPQHDRKPTFEEALAEIEPPSSQSRSVERRQSGLRILAVGDSTTHCNDGDFTWRYRLWEWFRSENIAMNFVGPYTGTAQPPISNATTTSPALLRTST